MMKSDFFAVFLDLLEGMALYIAYIIYRVFTKYVL